mmetsp:Transcript_118155/g.166082  ORF Transcript_118155/g.166082 Transcript_118155/m.166082 type:complete len:86 (+) Transcript_118155:558-815(+)
MKILETVDKNPRKKIEMETKMNSLFNILVGGTMNQHTAENLILLCEAVDAENFDEARQLQEKIAKDDFEANKDWIMAIRRIINRK